MWTTVGIVLSIGLIALGNRFQLTLDFAEQLGMQGWEILDPVIAILVAINILWAGLHLLLHTMSGLMDATLPEEELTEIVEVLEQFIASDQIAYHALRTRYAGARRFMSVHVLVPGQWSVKQGHDLLETIEHRIKAKFDHIDIETHLEPIEDAASWRH